MAIIKIGESYGLNQLAGYEYIKVLDINYHLVYDINKQRFDVYGKRNINRIRITSIWNNVQRTHQDSLGLEEKVNCQRTCSQS